MEKKYEVIDRIIEVGIYLYIILMFLSKGEGIRNILIFGNFSLWLLTLKYRKNLYLLKEPVSILCWVFLGVTFFSVIFSIDPLYSFCELREEPRKVALLFPVIATVMSDNKRLKRGVYVMSLTAICIVLIGYYSYFFHEIPFLKPDIPLMDTGVTGHNKFARYLNTLLPFAFILYFILKKPGLKAILTISFIISAFALILSTSRKGYLAFFSMACIWAVYLSGKKGFNLKKILAGIILITLLLGVISWFSFPAVRNRMSLLPEQLSTVNQRTQAWIPAIYAIKQRPLFGWGFGKRIFHREEPYKDTPYKKAPSISPHNTFLKVMFHQGIIGIIPFVLLILIAIKVFWKEAFETTGIRSYILVACVSVLIGNFIFNSMLADLKLRYLAVILGIGMAAVGADEDSHN